MARGSGWARCITSDLSFELRPVYMNHLIIFRAGCDIFSLLSKMQKEGSNQSKNV
jgi:hypothetical protein